MRARFKSFMAVAKEFHEDNEFLCGALIGLPLCVAMYFILNYFFPK